MALQFQNFPKKNVGLPHFTVSYPSGWSSNEQQLTQHLPKNTSFKMESPPQLYCGAKHLGLQSPDQESSSTLSIGQSQNEMSAGGRANSQDQCMSSESGQEESCGKSVEGKMKPVWLLTSPDVTFNPSQTDYSQIMACAPYHYADHYYGGLFTPYGPQAMIQPQMGSQMAAMTAGRVPLPFDVADDGPIFVNAKQYHGILRRRQSRAKLEAQNKLVKARKPYLHESRHLHALNRVRGSGGRFLSSKNLQQHDPLLSCSSRSIEDTIHLSPKNGSSMLNLGSYPSGAGHSGASNTSCSDITNVSNSDALSRQPDHGFSGISVHRNGGMLSSGGLMCG